MESYSRTKFHRVQIYRCLMEVNRLDGEKVKNEKRRVMFSSYIMSNKDIMFTCDKQDIEVSAFILNYKRNQ